MRILSPLLHTYRKAYSDRKNLSTFIVLNIVALLSSLVLMVAFANLLEKSVLGTYQYIVSAVSIVGAFSLSGLGPAFVRAIGKREYGFIPYGNNRALYWSVVPITISLIVGGYYLFNGNNILGYSIILSGIILAVTQYYNRLIHILNGLEMFVKSNLIQIAQVISPLLLLLPLLFFTSNPIILSISYFFGMLLATYVMVSYFNLNQTVAEFKSCVENAKYNASNIRFAVHQSVINVLGVVVAHFDKILMFQILGASQTANYILATTIPNKIKSLIKQFEPYVFSKFSKHTVQSAKLQLASKFVIGLVLCVPFILIYALSAEYIFKLLLPKYTDLIGISIVYSLAIFYGVNIIPYAVLRTHASNKTIYWATVLTAVLQVSMTGLGAVVGGTNGAIVGKMASSVFNTLVFFVVALFVVGKSSTNKPVSELDASKYDNIS